VVGPLAGATRIHLSVALEPRDPAALQAFATAVSTPGSNIYGQYITPAEFAQRFGPTSAQIESVEASLAAHGLSPGAPSANHLSIPLTASASQLERAFSLSLERITLTSGAGAIVNNAAPQLDGNVAGLVQGVVGLSSLSVPHPLFARPHAARPHASAHVATGGPQPCTAARSAAPGQAAYTADQIASAYGFSGFYSSGNKGKGQTVGLYELEPYSASDIAAYQSCYGTHAQVSNIEVDGGAGSGPGVGEAALDIEQSIGLAPEANFVVYEAPNSSSSSPGSGYYDNWNAVVTQDRARVVSASWGQCEPLESDSDAAAEATLFQEAAAQGQSIISASGDQGSEDCNNQTVLPDPSLAVDDPSSQPFVTGVGGTTMPALGPRPTEFVWNDGGGLSGLLGLAPGAGGGGRSTRWGMPSYQSSAPSFLHVNQSTVRESPDISADADPNTGYLIYWNGSGSVKGPAGWQGIGGTSAAAPVWASAFTLMNASRACGGGVIGFVNPALYQAAARSYAQGFNDITRGNNDFTGTNGGRFAAGSVFDMASGLGSPNASALTAMLCQHAARAGAPRIAGASLSGVHHAQPRLRLKLNAGRHAPALRKVAIKLPRGLRFGRRLGGISVSSRHAGKVRFTASVKHGTLTIRLKHTESQVTVTIRFSTLIATNHEIAAVKHGHAKRLRIRVAVTDAHRTTTRLAARVKPR
jgi:subtilase family serine protease